MIIHSCGNYCRLNVFSNLPNASHEIVLHSQVPVRMTARRVVVISAECVFVSLRLLLLLFARLWLRSRGGGSSSRWFDMRLHELTQIFHMICAEFVQQPRQQFPRKCVDLNNFNITISICCVWARYKHTCRVLVLRWSLAAVPRLFVRIVRGPSLSAGERWR